MDIIPDELKDLLNNTEVTLHLDISKSVKLYGEVDEQGFLNLNIREIATPDIYWSRSVLLAEIIDQSLTNTTPTI